MYHALRFCLRSVPKSRLSLWDPVDCSPPGPSVHGISQVRILEWVAMPFSREVFPNPGIRSAPLALADGFFTTELPTALGLAQYVFPIGKIL